MYMLMQREESEEYQGYEWSCANLYWNLNWISFNFQVDFSLLLLCTSEKYKQFAFTENIYWSTNEYSLKRI